MTKQEMIEYAEKFEDMADELYPCDFNLPRHASLISKAMKLREMAENYKGETR